MDLIIEIRCIAQAPNDEPGTCFAGGVHGQAVEGDEGELHARLGGQGGGGVFEQGEPDIGGKQAGLAVMHPSTQNQMIHQSRGTRDDVQMPVGDGIEAAGIKADTCFHEVIYPLRRL